MFGIQQPFLEFPFLEIKGLKTLVDAVGDLQVLDTE